MTLKNNGLVIKDRDRGWIMQIARATSDRLVRGLVAAVTPSILAWAAIVLLARHFL